MVKVVYLLRHGETAWSLSGQHTGLTDIPLTRNGRKEARVLKKSLKGVRFDHVLCSPLIRARETCDIVGYETEAVFDRDLVEWDYGDYEGLTSEEIQKTNPGWTVFTCDPPNGETSKEVEARADRVIQKVLNLEGTVAIFSSGHFSRVLGARWLGLPYFYGGNLLFSTGRKSILGFEKGLQAFVSWNSL